MALTLFQTSVLSFADPEHFVNSVLGAENTERLRHWQRLVDHCGEDKAAEAWIDGFACQGEHPSGTPGERLPCDNDVVPGDVFCRQCREKDNHLQALSDDMDRLDAEQRRYCLPGCPKDCDGPDDQRHTGSRPTLDTPQPDTASVPTDPYALAEMLGNASNAETNALYDRLAARTDIDHAKAKQIWERALDIVVHDENCATNTRILREAIQTALSQVEAAGGALSELVDLHHADYADSTAGQDMTAFLADAARSLRAAEALNPAPTEQNEEQVFTSAS